MNITFTVLALAALLATVLACAWLVRRYRGTKLFANTYNAPNAGRHSTGIISYKADGAIGRFKVVARGAGTPTSEYVKIGDSATEKPLGVTIDEISAAEATAGQTVAVAVLGACTGTILVVANAAITIDDWVQSAGNGKVKTLVATGYCIGRALQAAQADGDIIEIAPSGISSLAAV